MPYEIRFDIAGVIITLILLYVYFTYKHFPTWRSKIFLYLALDVLISVLLNIVTCYTNFYWKHDMLIWKNILNVVHIIFVNLIPLLYFIYIFALTHLESDFTSKFKIIIIIPIIYELFSISTSPLTHYVMYFDESGNYCHGIGMTILYAISIYFMLLGLFMIICSKIKIDWGKKSVAIFYTAATLITTIIQYRNPHLLLICFACSISLFLTYLTIQNPLTFIDQNTDTYNRAAFNEIISSKIDSTKPYALVILQMKNLDKLKELFGIENGYYIVRQFTKGIRSQCNDSMLFHLFGNCYIYICKNETEAQTKANSILSFLQKSFFVEAEYNAVTKIEYPLATYVYLIKDIRSWYSGEKTNQHLVLDNIIGTIQYAVETNTSQDTTTVHVIGKDEFSKYQHKMLIQKAVHEAMENDTFEVFLQPIYDLQSHTFTSAESLLRLKDADGTYITPSQFIPEAERTGDILKIGDISIKKTCEFILNTDLLNHGITKININLSMIQCMQEGIVGHIANILESYSIPKDCIRFEITESMVVKDESRLEEMIKRMQAYGIQFALDDYGTGYSNTSRIMHFPFTEIKFDKSMIDALPHDTSSKISLKHLFSMIKERGMIVLAEGIETEELAVLLDNLGCNLIQGFYYAKPMSQEAFIAFLSHRA